MQTDYVIHKLEQQLMINFEEVKYLLFITKPYDKYLYFGVHKSFQNHNLFIKNS